MAHEPIIPSAISERLKALVSGGPSSQGLERERINSNPQGGTPASKEQGSHSDNREHGGRRAREAEAAGHEGNRELSIPTAKVDPFVSGDYVLKAIMDKFVELRENCKVGAWKQLQSDLMRAAPVIVPT